MKLDFGVGLGAELRLDEIAEHSRVADECGFSHITFVDQSNVSRECHAMMTIAGLNTRRAMIGAGVCDPVMYHPAVIGNFTASLREMTGGRVIVGLGAGTKIAGKAIERPTGMKALRETVGFLRNFLTGDDAELWGQTWHSEWLRETPWKGHEIKIFLGPVGPKMMQLAGELADEIWVFGGGEPELAKWYLEQIETGAERAGRDFSEIRVWARTEVYIAPTKEDARREVASYAASNAAEAWRAIFARDTPEAQDLARRLERKRPGLVDSYKVVHDNFNPYVHEKIDAPHSEYVTQEIIDTYNLVGPLDEIVERARTLQEMGFAGLSCVQYAIIDQVGNMRRIADELMPHFR